jgi:steroid delta-isomerase-like uncharacterized protein
MAENENIQLAKQAIADLNARALDRYVQRIDDSYIGESEIASDPVRGPAGARQMIERMLTAFPDLRFEIEQILASGDFVVTRVHLTGTHKGNFLGIPPTNKKVSWRGCNVGEIRNGKAVRGRIYADTASLFQQLGVLSLPKATTAG